MKRTVRTALRANTILLLCAVVLLGAVLSVSANAETIAITRLYNPATGEHMLASSDAEISMLTSAGWSVDGVMCTMPTSGTPIYRLYNQTSGEHLYTMVTSEIEKLTAGSWVVDGVIAYSAGSDGTPIYRLYNAAAPEISSHLLSTSQTEMNTLTASGWTVEGIALYASPEGGQTDSTTDSTTTPTTDSTAGSTDPTDATTDSTTDSTASTEPGIEEHADGTEYVLNTKTKKFHLPGCSYLPDENRMDITTYRDELTAAGYEPCKRCDP